MSALSPEVAAVLREYARRNGRIGGLTRAKNMTAKDRRASALKASKAAAAARTRKAKQKKAAAQR
jgi:hypothetical protein